MQLSRDVFIFPLTSLDKLKKPLNIGLGLPEPGTRAASGGRARRSPLPGHGWGLWPPAGYLLLGCICTCARQPCTPAGSDSHGKFVECHRRSCKCFVYDGKQASLNYTPADYYVDKTVQRFRQKLAYTVTLHKRASDALQKLQDAALTVQTLLGGHQLSWKHRAPAALLALDLGLSASGYHKKSNYSPSQDERQSSRQGGREEIGSVFM